MEKVEGLENITTGLNGNRLAIAAQHLTSVFLFDFNLLEKDETK